MTKVITAEHFDEVVRALQNNCIVAFPTDTVYGIGVLCNSQASERMKQAKIRPDDKPFPVMVASLEQLELVGELSWRERTIADRFWPGALTMILKSRHYIDNGLDTIAVRIPNDSWLLKLLEEVGPMYVTSANLSGQPSCTDHSQVLQQLDGRIDYVVEGQADSPVSSTIIDCSSNELSLLRQGDVTMDHIIEALL